jgi:ElaB/YqjD/DUF883 family membrane-anchored ribosome-binding protein
MEHVSQRVHEGYDSAREEAARRYRRVEGMVARNPAPSVLIGFGVGFGLGLILTTMLSQEEESWSDWSRRKAHDSMDSARDYARDSMRHARRSMHHAQDAMRHMPDAFHSLAESIRALPDAIARNLPSGLTRH